MLRYDFGIVRNIPREKYLALVSFVESNGGRMGRKGKYWGFRIQPQSYDHVQAYLNNNGFVTHTLGDHLDKVRHFFAIPPKRLGGYCYLLLPAAEKWQFLDPISRQWTYIKTLDELGVKGATVRAGSVLRSFNKGNQQYFKVNDAGTKINPLNTKRAATNLAALYFEPKKAYWASHRLTWALSIRTLGVVPDDIFFALARMRPFVEVPEGVFAFAHSDFNTVQEFLKVIRIELVRCSKLIMLPGDESRAMGTPLIYFTDIEPQKSQAIRSLLEDFGAKTEISGSMLSVMYRNDHFKLGGFIEADDPYYDGTLYIPLHSLEDANAFATAMASIMRRLRIREPHPEKILSVHWPVGCEADGNFILDTFIHHMDDEEFTAKILAQPSKLALVRQWYVDCINNTDFNVPESFAFLELLRTASRVLSAI